VTQIASLWKVDIMEQTLSNGVRIKVAEKTGAISLYLGRFPVSPYASQWIKLLEVADEIEAFVSEAVENGSASVRENGK